MSSLLCGMSVNSFIILKKMVRWEVRLQNAFLVEVVDNRRHVQFDRRQQLCGSDTEVDVEIAIEELSVGAFSASFTSHRPPAIKKSVVTCS